VKTKSQYPEKFNQLDFIAKLQAGDEAAFREFDDEFFSRFTAFAEKEFGINQEDAKDLAQDVTINIFQKAKLYDPARGQFVQWVFGILRNRCIDWLRKRKKLPFKSLTVEIADTVAQEISQTSRDNLSPLEKLPPEVREAILRLPGRYQQFIGLTLLNAPESYIKDILQIKTASTFRNLKFRAFARLRKEIQQPK
jgi:RNA polymerase sigma-70 factor (ECF subfamily)